MRTTSNAAPGGYKMQQRSNVMDVAAFKDNQLASPDGTPPSNGLAEEAFRSATPSYYRRGTQQGWLGTDYRPDVGPAKPLGLRPEVNGTGSGITTEGSDIIGLMEAVWFGPPSSSYGTSGSSGFSGFHDSATSMSNGRGGRTHTLDKVVVGNGSGSNHSSNRSRNSVGSVTSTGYPPEAEQQQHPEEPHAQRPNGTARKLTSVQEATAAPSGLQQQDDRAQSCKAASTRGNQGGNDWLGTWAKRQVHYAQPPPPSLPAHIPGTPQPSDRSVARRPLRSTDGEGNDAAKCADDTATTSIGPENSEEGAAEEGREEAEGELSSQPTGQSEESDTLADDEEKLRQAAWRWRFNRRWAQEQARQMDPQYGLQAGDEDGWDEALGYMDACGPGWHLQIARTTSDDGLANSSLISHASGLSTCFLGDSQRSRTLATTGDGSGMGEATKGIVQVARKAANLYEHQQAIEDQVRERWDSASHAGMNWAGQELPAVQIDKFGRFPFVLVKLSDRLAGSKLLVRGKNGRSEMQLVSAVTKEVLGITSRGRLPQASVTLMGSGSMEWIRERDRVINVSAGKVVSGLDGSIHSKEDVARLTAALTRASLPMHYRVTIEGEKVS
ncbi:g6677 [Coccomyxa elongata]